MFRKLLNLFGRKRFDKTEKIAPAVIQKIDNTLFQTPEAFSSDGAGSLTLTEEYEQWVKVQSKTTNDMTPQEYNKMLVEEYGPFEDRRVEELSTFTYRYPLEDSEEHRVNKL